MKRLAVMKISVALEYLAIEPARNDARNVEYNTILFRITSRIRLAQDPDLPFTQSCPCPCFRCMPI